MRFLCRQLLFELRSGDKIFVHKTAVAPPMDEVLTLHAAMRRHGPANLLHVRRSAPGFPNGTLVQVAPGLLVGTLFDFIAARTELESRAADLFARLQRGEVKSHVGARVALKDAAEAHRELTGRRTIGATVLLP